jgi:hypothetical protein
MRTIRAAVCCLLALAGLISPRLAIGVWWLLDTVRWSGVFDGPIVPILGFLFLPWTTLMWVWLAPGGVGGVGLLFLLIALIVDVSAWGGGQYARVR